MVLTKTDQLDKLFNRWQDRSSENIKLDGINNEVEYSRASPKVLFIMKEPNDPKQKTGSFPDWWEKTIKYTFSIRLGEWSYGILNDFPDFDSFHKSRSLKHQAIQQIAFMNIKKVGGPSKSSKKTITDYTINYLDLIQEEIEIIDPDLIILGVSFWKEISKKIFPDVNWEKSGYGIDIAKYHNVRLIDFYHPTVPNKESEELYYLLQKIIYSEKFVVP